MSPRTAPTLQRLCTRLDASKPKQVPRRLPTPFFVVVFVSLQAKQPAVGTKLIVHPIHDPTDPLTVKLRGKEDE